MHWNRLESIKLFNNVFLLLPRARRAADWLGGPLIYASIRWETRQSRPLPELRLSARNPALVIAHVCLSCYLARLEDLRTPYI